LYKESITVDGIKYTPPNYLRMSMYLELSRPDGDVGRWEKVLKRLTLLNKHYPVKSITCESYNFQQKIKITNEKSVHKLFDILKNEFIDNNVVFFGSYALSAYYKYSEYKQPQQYYPDFNVISENGLQLAKTIKQLLIKSGLVKTVEIIEHDAIGELILNHYEIRVDKVYTVAFIYEPVACHSYNTVQLDKKYVKIATIDTMMSFYLAFLYANREYYNPNNILCLSNFLFQLQKHNRLAQKGVLKRFSGTCYGYQQTLPDMRAKKTEKIKELVKGTSEYNRWFLNYRPDNRMDNSTKTNVLNKLMGEKSRNVYNKKYIPNPTEIEQKYKPKPKRKYKTKTKRKRKYKTKGKRKYTRKVDEDNEIDDEMDEAEEEVEEEDDSWNTEPTLVEETKPVEYKRGRGGLIHK